MIDGKMGIMRMVFGTAQRRAPALALGAGLSVLALGPAVAQMGGAQPVPGTQELKQELKERNRRSAEEQDRKLRRADERANRAATGVCTGCFGSAARGGRTQPADPFAHLPDTDEVPLPRAPGIDDEPLEEGSGMPNG